MPREVWTIRPWPTGNDRLGSTCHHLSLCELLTRQNHRLREMLASTAGFFFEFSGISMSKSPCRSLSFCQTVINGQSPPSWHGRCDIHRNPKVVKGKKTKPADAKGTMVYRTGKANDPRAWIPWIPWIPIVKYWDPAVSKSHSPLGILIINEY